jgi:hypothetical protein
LKLRSLIDNFLRRCLGNNQANPGFNGQSMASSIARELCRRVLSEALDPSSGYNANEKVF